MTVVTPDNPQSSLEMFSVLLPVKYCKGQSPPKSTHSFRALGAYEEPLLQNHDDHAEEPHRMSIDPREQNTPYGKGSERVVII